MRWCKFGATFCAPSFFRAEDASLWTLRCGRFAVDASLWTLRCGRFEWRSNDGNADFGGSNETAGSPRVGGEISPPQAEKNLWGRGWREPCASPRHLDPERSQSGRSAVQIRPIRVP